MNNITEAMVVQKRSSFYGMSIAGHQVHIALLKSKIAASKSSGKNTSALEAKLDRHLAEIKKQKKTSMKEHIGENLTKEKL